jgi:hypothetical protein
MTFQLIVLSHLLLLPISRNSREKKWKFSVNFIFFAGKTSKQKNEKKTYFIFPYHCLTDKIDSLGKS